MEVNNNNIEKLMLDHRTIRSFTTEKLTDEQVDHLLQVAQRTATSHYMQAYSVIRIKAQAQLDRLSKIGNHKFTAGEELVIFIVDQHRNVDLAKKSGAKIDYLVNFDRFLAGVMDASLAAQSLTLAAESEGLGAVIMGSYLDDAEQMIEVLDLPMYTFPALGVVIGHPNEKPQQKPRLPKPIFQMTDRYQLVENYDEQMDKFDETVHAYYNERAGSPRQESFSELIARFASHGNPKRNELYRLITQQGFKLNN